MDASGLCIADVTVEIVRGEGAGQRQKQTTPCGAWDYVHGFEFRNLTAGAELTVRASAPGYRTGEVTFVAYNLYGGYTSVLIQLPRVD